MKDRKIVFYFVNYSIFLQTQDDSSGFGGFGADIDWRKVATFQIVVSIQ